jgi:hypothetical protein
MVGRGYSEDQIIQDFKDRFGPEVLIANAAMAPNAEGRVFNKRTFGFLLLLASVSLAAFSLGNYTKSAPSSTAKRRPPPRSKTTRSQTRQSRRRVEDHIDTEKEDFLDDHEI